jgi:hypothetical protein
MKEAAEIPMNEGGALQKHVESADDEFEQQVNMSPESRFVLMDIFLLDGL